jgi:KTSC domain
MQRQAVESSSLASVGYDGSSRTLEVEFRNGGVYQYLGVSPSLHRALMNAESRGAFLNTRIKPHFPCERLEPNGRARGRS